jgi:hypothetical protein
MQVKKGNRLRFWTYLKDENGNVLTNLTSAAAMFFQIKTSPTASTPTLNISLTEMEIDTPTIGAVRITLSPTQTAALTITTYYKGFQIQWGTDNIQEPDLFENYKVNNEFKVLQNIV